MWGWFTEQLSLLLSKWQGFSISLLKTSGGGINDTVMGIISTIKSKQAPWEYGNECWFQSCKWLLEAYFYDKPVKKVKCPLFRDWALKEFCNLPQWMDLETISQNHRSSSSHLHAKRPLRPLQQGRNAVSVSDWQPNKIKLFSFSFLFFNNYACREFLRWTTCLNSISILKNDLHPHKKGYSSCSEW